MPLRRGGGGGVKWLAIKKIFIFIFAASLSGRTFAASLKFASIYRSSPVIIIDKKNSFIHRKGILQEAICHTRNVCWSVWGGLGFTFKFKNQTFRFHKWGRSYHFVVFVLEKAKKYAKIKINSLLVRYFYIAFYYIKNTD